MTEPDTLELRAIACAGRKSNRPWGLTNFYQAQVRHALVMSRAIEVRVSGEVQGVSFRGYAAREAVRLELVGWVRNEPDGSVLGHFEGPAADVEKMLDWCREGSPSADVHRLEIRDVRPIGASEFSVED